MNSPSKKVALPFKELVALMALMTALTALSIDAMLPALSDIGRDLNASNPNDVQLIISLIFLGTALGQMFYGPLSDSIGRKPTVILGIGIYIIGCLLSIFAQDFNWMLIGRFLQGVGVGAPRIMALAIIRDQFEGSAMARVMSYVFTTFIIVPLIAPSIGQLILLVASWHMIFILLLVMSLVILMWFLMRQPETLSPDHKRPFALNQVFTSIKQVLLTPAALGYTVANGLSSSPFVAFLSSVQQILQEQYALGTLFPLVFSFLTLFVGGATFVNARWVVRLGMQVMTRYSLIGLCISAIGFGIVAYFYQGRPPLWTLIVYFAITLFCIGILFGNLSSLAMEHLGHIAGTGAAVTNSLSTLISLPLGILIGYAYNGTVFPLVIGFGLCGYTALLAQKWAESHKA